MSYVKKTHRFGLLTPSSNTTQEPEFSAALPPTSRCTPGASPTATSRRRSRCAACSSSRSESRKLADAEVDCHRVRGDRADPRQGQGLRPRADQAHGGCLGPAGHHGGDRLRRCADAARRRRRSRSARRGARPWTSRWSSSWRRAASRSCTARWSASWPAIELGRVGPETAYELGRRTDRPDADAIIMPGGNWACDAGGRAAGARTRQAGARRTTR